jgi:hypothetical protein
MDNTFKCDRCGGCFEKGWTDEERDLEATDNGFFDNVKLEDLLVVCDDCYKIGMNCLN